MTKVPPQNPRMLEALRKIQAVLKAADLGASVILVDGNGNGEYMNHMVGPTWSALTSEKRSDGQPGTYLRLKARIKSAPFIDRHREYIKLKKTVNGIAIISDLHIIQSENFARLLLMCEENVKITYDDVNHIPRDKL